MRRQLEANPEDAEAIAAALIEAAKQSTRAGVEAASKVMDRVDGPVKHTLDEDAMAALRPHLAVIMGALPKAQRPELPKTVENVASDGGEQGQLPAPASPDQG